MTKNRIIAGSLALIMLASASPVFAAREIGSGGGPVTNGGGGSSVCSPISSFSVKGDARVGETGLASIDVNYSVKPCVSGQSVRVVSQVIESSNGFVLYDDQNAPLQNKYTVFGIKVSTSYRCVLTVLDGATGSVLGSSTLFCGAARKVGV